MAYPPTCVHVWKQWDTTKRASDCEGVMQDMTSHDSAVGAKITQVFSVGKNNQARVSFMNLMICFVEDKY